MIKNKYGQMVIATEGDGVEWNEAKGALQLKSVIERGSCFAWVGSRLSRASDGIGEWCHNQFIR